MATKVGDAFVEIGAKTDRLNRGLKQSRTMMGGLGSMALRVGGLIAGAFAGRAMARGVKNMVVEASNAQETFQKFDVVFKDVGIAAEKSAQKLQSAFGMSGVHAKELLGDTGDLLAGFGFASDETLRLSSEVAELAADLASFTNIEGGAARATKALTRLLVGETEPAKALGIVVRQDTEEFKRLTKENRENKGMTLLQAKAQASLTIAFSQSKNAMGDYARTSESLANRMKRLGERAQDMRVVIGTGIADFFNISDAVDGFTKKIEGLTDKLEALAANKMFARWAAEIKFTMAEIWINMKFPWLMIGELVSKSLQNAYHWVEWFGKATKATFLNIGNTIQTVWSNMTANLGGAMAQLNAEMRGEAWNLGDQVSRGLLDGLENGAVEMPKMFSEAFDFKSVMDANKSEREAAWAEFLATQKGIDDKMLEENNATVDKQVAKEKELQKAKQKTIGISQSFADIVRKSQEFAERSTDKGRAAPGVGGIGAAGMAVLKEIAKNTAEFAVLG